MMFSKYVLRLEDPQATIERVGGKGASLARLINANLPVPEGFHITTDAYYKFVDEHDLQPCIDGALLQVDPANPETLEEASRIIRNAFLSASIPSELASAIVGAYGDLSGTNPAVAVRSSATAEDLPEASFAGQQETFLNVSGANHVLKASKKCWASLWTARAIGYRLKQGIESEKIALAVVVQRLIPAEVAGILFTANPMNGNRDQAYISSSWGLGDAVVGGRVTADNFIVDVNKVEVVEREIADKEVMTVRTNGDTEDQPVPQNLRRVPSLEDPDLITLTEIGVQIQDLYNMPMDIEWVLADGVFSIVQARPITALPDEPLPPPEEWELPHPKGRYMRASIVDLMPDPLSTLYGTMGISIYNRALVRFLNEITNSKKDVIPEDLVLTIHDYAFMTVNFTAGEWWAMLSKLAPKLIGLIREGPDHFREVALPQYQNIVAALEGKPLAEMSEQEILKDARTLIDAAMYHLGVLQVDTLGASAGSEGLFTAAYERFARQEGDPPAPALLMGYDTIPIQSEKSLYDLAKWVETEPVLRDYLLTTSSEDLAKAYIDETQPETLPKELWLAWRSRLSEYLDAFGYIMYDLDFAKPVPADDPTPMLETVKMFLRGEGSNPHERQRNLAEGRERAKREIIEPLKGLRGWIVRKTFGWAESLAQVREDSIASLGLGYPRARKLLLELGRRVVTTGLLQDPGDIFWLTEDELERAIQALPDHKSLQPLVDDIEKRKSRVDAAKKVVPPTQLPPSKTYMGIPIEAFVPGEGGQEGDKLKGVGASAGTVTGEACVLHGPEDFDQMRPGVILVAKMTTPAWTPLFAMASAVVTDIGGPLSHGSIVAREFGIPAVLGTAMATRVIQSGWQITVDGNEGYVTIHENA
jgi:phosphoenolpyruvate synthase/pyruvate phosphate dikinase